MTRRDIVIVLGTLVVAVGLSAILFVGAAATSPASGLEPVSRPRVFFDPRNSLPPGRTIVDAQQRVAAPFQAIVPLQRGVSDTARDAAGLFLVLLLTAFAVLCVFALLALLVGFAATSWRLGDALLRTRALSRFQAQIPAPVVALGGATILFVVWQIPALGAIALAGVVAYALGAVVTARLIKEGVTT